MKLYGHNRANRRSAFIFALHCKKVWRLLIRGAPGVTYKGDGVTYKGDGLLIRRGPPFEWVSRTDVTVFHSIDIALWVCVSSGNPLKRGALPYK